MVIYIRDLSINYYIFSEKMKRKKEKDFERLILLQFYSSVSKNDM